MSINIGAILGMASMMAAEMQYQQDEWKDRIRKQWKESRNLPRKKKKALRKSLLVNWSIACWNPMEF
jgi:hypothetical protein